jgi:hypothetical protein
VNRARDAKAMNKRLVLQPFPRPPVSVTAEEYCACGRDLPLFIAFGTGFTVFLIEQVIDLLNEIPQFLMVVFFSKPACKAHATQDGTRLPIKSRILVRTPKSICRLAVS